MVTTSYADGDQPFRKRHGRALGLPEELASRSRGSRNRGLRSRSRRPILKSSRSVHRLCPGTWQPNRKPGGSHCQASNVAATVEFSSIITEVVCELAIGTAQGSGQDANPSRSRGGWIQTSQSCNVTRRPRR